MQTRKLVKTGAETYTLSLPKSWVKENKLTKGSTLYIKENIGKLEITPDSKEEKEKKETTITLDDKEINTIRRETISAYINNTTEFLFIGESLTKKLEEIRKILNNFLALEIVEQTQTRMVVKDYLDMKEFSLDNIIRRMDMLVRSMIADSKESAKDKGITNSIMLRDYEVDKLFFLLSRLVRSRKIDSKQAIGYWWMAKNLENIADHVKELSQKFEATQEDKIPTIYSKIEEYYKEAIKAYFNKDKNLADNLIARRGTLLPECEQTKDKELSCKLKDLVDQARNIAKIVLDS